MISDEPYREIVFDGKNFSLHGFHLRKNHHLLFLQQVHLSSRRADRLSGRFAMDEDGKKIVDMCGQISRGIGHNCPSSIIQMAVIDLLEDTSDLSVYETNMNLLYDKLTDLGFSCVRPGGTFYMFPKALEEDANAFCMKAREYDLLLVPGDTFGCPGYFGFLTAWRQKR